MNCKQYKIMYTTLWRLGREYFGSLECALVTASIVERWLCREVEVRDCLLGQKKKQAVVESWQL